VAKERGKKGRMTMEREGGGRSCEEKKKRRAIARETRVKIKKGTVDVRTKKNGTIASAAGKSSRWSKQRWDRCWSFLVCNWPGQILVPVSRGILAGRGRVDKAKTNKGPKKGSNSHSFHFIFCCF